MQIAELPLLFFGAVQNAVFARISGASKEKATKTMSFLVRIGVIAWIIIVGLGISVIPYLMTTFLNKNYEASAKAFSFLIGGTTAVGITRLLTPYFLGQLQRPGLLSALAWVNVVINIIACWLLIPTLSVNGAAIASLISYSANLFINF